jgi:dUTP pyrophosphatase
MYANVIIKRNGLPEKYLLPSIQHEGDAGMDLRSANYYKIAPHQCVLVDTGIQIEFSDNFVAMVCPRSGLALKQQLTVLNSPGIVDSSYRGNVGVILMNHSNTTRYINIGDRIAQLCILEVCKVTVFESEEDLSETNRGSGGFGSTGN